MIRVFCLLLFALQAGAVFAASSTAPIVKTSLSEETAIPGQAIIFRVSVLVPTWMLSPPVFPSFEVPNVAVRLPSRSAQPVSETVDGETWSGVSRAYRLYPMVPGRFSIPADEIQVTYADPQTREPIVVKVPIDTFEIVGEVPEAAKTLDPFLAANSLSIDRKIEGDAEALNPGDALTLTTTIKVGGVSPMFVPPLPPIPSDQGYSTYAKEPVVTEKEDRGVLSGERTQSVTVIAENQGTYDIPELALSWFNLETGKIETATAPGLSLTITGAAATPTSEESPLDWKPFAYSGLASALVIFALYRLSNLFLPQLRRALRQHRARYQASETYAYKLLMKEISQRNLAGVEHAGLRWKSLAGAQDPTINWKPFEDALLTVRAPAYISVPPGGKSGDFGNWQSLEEAVRDTRVNTKKNRKSASRQPLRPLNPGA
ncbi:hypothetical protein [uncultured Roseibium sp.]|uniref:hypothetical protein n=1 Tax=uncultured Roseibium sp. TaxID=1936171 RepID=UPI00262C304A|nr:hypothetical protein [uncultured Roseibium sp.]